MWFNNTMQEPYLSVPKQFVRLQLNLSTAKSSENVIVTIFLVPKVLDQRIFICRTLFFKIL